MLMKPTHQKNTTDANEAEEDDPVKRRTEKRKSRVWNDFIMMKNHDETRKGCL